MRIATCCGLLVALAGTTSLAQTHPTKQQKSHRKPVIVHKAAPVARQVRGEYRCFLSLEEPQASTVVAAPNQAYTYVEQMPKLPEASDMVGIVAALRRRVLVPPLAPEGRVFVPFLVTKEGAVSQPQVVKGLRADVDSAVVTATRKLPRFTPGKHNGTAVAVSMTLPVTFAGQQQP
jgi:hypothetical protein